MVEPADLILANGRLWDGHHVDGRDAVAVAAGRILATGTAAELEQFRSPTTTTVDVGGRRVIPGLIDSHIHMVRAGRSWNQEVSWHDVTSLEEALHRLATAAEKSEPGRWLSVSGGWHPKQFQERRPPNRTDLDEAAPTHPVFVQRNYIEAFLNTPALQASGLGADEEGRVEGVAALQSLRQRIPSPDPDQQVEGTRSLLRHLNGLGVTGCIDAGGFGMAPPAYEPIRALNEAEGLGFRARLLVGAGTPGDEEGQLQEWMDKVSPGTGDDQLRWLGAGEVLVFAAHDMEGLDARDISSARDQLVTMTRILVEAGWPAHVHAILDSSVRTVLDAWRQIDQGSLLGGLRYTITHADQVGPESLTRIRQLGLGVTVQNGMAFRGDDSLPTWGADRVASAPPLRTMVDMGIPLAAGTDATVVSSPNPWPCIHWMVTGVGFEGCSRRGEEQCLTVDEALRLYTSGSAWFSFEEASRGNLAPDSHADLVVLSDDLIEVPTERIRSIRSLLTLVGGDIVHAAPPFSAM